MLRLCCRTTRRSINFLYRRRLSSSSLTPKNGNNTSSKSLENAQFTPSSSAPPLPILYPKPKFNHVPVLALSATALVSGIIASSVLIHNGDASSFPKNSPIYQDLEVAIEKSNESFRKILHRMKQTGVAATVLWKSLRSVMSSANHEVRTGFELRVAAFLADIAAASDSRRAAIVTAGGGAVIDWLLETVAAASAENLGAQAEAARALAYLIADRNVCEEVLGRPYAIPSLLRFIFLAQPRKNQRRRSSFDLSDSVKGRSMLVAAIMEIVTSSCESVEKVSFKPLLPKNAEMRDIAAAIEVIQEGGVHWDETSEDDEDDKGGKGMKGIGIKILEGTTVLGLSRSSRLSELEDYDMSRMEMVENMPQSLSFNHGREAFPARSKLTTTVVPGLWDDLQSEHVAVPFAAWALANWAMASEVNRSHIQELDRDGQAVMTALVAPERSVKWHGSLVARLLLEDRNLPLNESVSDWGSSLLSTIFQAGKAQDVALAQVALSAFLVCIERSHDAREVVMEKGLPLIRETAEQIKKGKSVQESLAKALEIMCSGELHMSLEESQRWSAILLPWVFSKQSSDALRTSAINILSHILEDYGPSSLPISQGWLTLLLTDILNSKKMSLIKEATVPPNDKVKTQIDQSNLVAATQIMNQLAGVVVNLAGIQLGVATDNEDTFPLMGLLSIEPFNGPFKTLKKDKKPKINAADSALATLKGVKSLTEVCGEDSVSLGRIVDFGVLCLLRRLLLEDDYEQLAAIEAYDASRAFETQERVSSSPGETSTNSTSESSSLRVPPTAHIRRHAARLLTVLSLLPKVQKAITSDDAWLNWLEECANGRIPGCNDLKIQSYARATLLNVLCACESSKKPDSDNAFNSSSLDRNNTCPRFADMIFLINPERSHWKCPNKVVINSGDKSSPMDGVSVEDEEVTSTARPRDEVASTSGSGSESSSQLDSSPLDIVFVHGLRGGPFKSWRLSDDKSSTKSGLVEKIDEEAGKQGTFWPGEWLSGDFPDARIFTLRYKTNLTQWSGATLPLQEVSSMLLEKLTDAGIGKRPVVFVTHSLGGLAVKQMLFQAKAENKDELIRNTIGLVFYSCPHFGSKLADMPWRMGLVLRPAPTIGELRSGSPRLLELNDLIQGLHKNGSTEVLSFCETKVTPLVEGYGGWAFRMEVVPIESAYPGFGELVVLESTDHVNSCKPLSRSDPSYKETLDFLRKLKERHT